MRNIFTAHILLLLVNLFYGANYTIAKEAMPHFIQPFGFILIRVVSAVVVFTLLQKLFFPEKVHKEDWFRLFLCGVFGVAVNQLMFFKGLNLTTPINAALMMIMTPIIVMVIATISRVERLTSRKIGGIVLAAAGAAIIIAWGQHITVGSSTAMGDFFVLINASSFALYLVLVKPLMLKYHPLTVIRWAFTFGALFVIPAGFEELQAVEWSTFPTRIWMSVFYVIVFATFLTYLLNVFALRKVNPSVVGIYIYLQPVIASAVAISFGRDSLDMVKVSASLLIILGVYIVSKQRTAV